MTTQNTQRRTTPRIAQPINPPRQVNLFEQPITTTEKRVMTAGIKPQPGLSKGDVIRSVGQAGILQPLLLRPSRDPSYSYEVVAGGRRLHSALHFKLPDVPAIITRGDESEAQLAMMTALENTARSPNPVAEGQAFEKVLNSGLYPNEQEMAAEMGLKVQQIRKRLKLVKLPSDILSAIEAGKLSESTAERIVNLPVTYRQEAIASARQAIVADVHFSASDLKLVRTRQGSDLAGVMSKMITPQTQPQPQLIHLSAEQVLAEEIRLIVQERKAELSAVLAHLGYVALEKQGESHPLSSPSTATSASKTLPFKAPAAPLPSEAAVASLPFKAPAAPLPFEAAPLPFIQEPKVVAEATTLRSSRPQRAAVISDLLTANLSAVQSNPSTHNASPEQHEIEWPGAVKHTGENQIDWPEAALENTQGTQTLGEQEEEIGVHNGELRQEEWKSILTEPVTPQQLTLSVRETPIVMTRLAEDVPMESIFTVDTRSELTPRINMQHAAPPRI